MKFIQKHVYFLLFFLTAATIATGTLVYNAVEGLSLIDAYYFSVVTLLTIGYGDITPQTNFGKIFTTFYVLIGIGIIGAIFGALVTRGSERIAEQIRRHDDKIRHHK